MEVSQKGIGSRVLLVQGLGRHCCLEESDVLQVLLRDVMKAGGRQVKFGASSRRNAGLVAGCHIRHAGDAVNSSIEILAEPPPSTLHDAYAS